MLVADSIVTFVMITYSEAVMPENTFALPDYCNEYQLCPPTSHCAQIQGTPFMDQ